MESRQNLEYLFRKRKQ
jgi:serine/threonine protein kinase